MEGPKVRTAAPAEALRVALARLDEGARVVVATVLKRRGSAPSTPGQKLALLAPDEAVGTIGGGAVEREVLAAMQAMLATPGAGPEIVRHELGASLGMCCGGAVELLLEPMDAAVAVLVIGAGHIGGALAPTLAGLGYRVVVADSREQAPGMRAQDVARGVALLPLEHDDPEVAAALGPPERAAVVVMTHDHQLDQAAIEWALGVGASFVGGVGSRAKAVRTRQRLEARGFSAVDVERVRMPLGLDIGARSPGEIAVAIAGELVAWRARLLGRERRPSSLAP